MPLNSAFTLYKVELKTTDFASAVRKREKKRRANQEGKFIQVAKTFGMSPQLPRRQDTRVMRDIADMVHADD